MRLILLATLILAIVATGSVGKAQYQHPNSPYVFRGYQMMAREQDSRFFFGSFSFTTFTYTVTTTTTTATATSTTTCTTSSATLTTCTAGRRRRHDKNGNLRNPRGLFYEEKDEDVEGSIFLPALVPTVEESDAARISRQLEAQPAIPLAIQPTFGAFFAPEVGFEIPAAVPVSRIFLAFGTATVTVTTTTTATLKLTATCSSTTGFSLCVS